MVLFLNGLVQNGAFTFREDPGKAVGIRLASALNTVLGNAEAPHLWNTVTLLGDLRYRTQSRTAALHRAAFERARTLEKYGTTLAPAPATVTDADPEVAELALSMVDERLSNGMLRIGTVPVQECANCGHTVGLGALRCTSCTGGRLLARRMQHLVEDRSSGQAVLPPGLLHARNRRFPRHLAAISRDVPHRLILSRPRSHGVRLDALGLRGLVLDPRVGLHVTALHAARRHGARSAAMTVTPNALAHIAAYAHGFTSHNGYRLRYTLHGRIPYGSVPELRRAYDFHRASRLDQDLFESWFLPLLSWRNKNSTRAGQLPALLKYFLKARRADTRGSSHGSEYLRNAILAGDPAWVMDQHLLAAAMPRNERPALHA